MTRLTALNRPQAAGPIAAPAAGPIARCPSGARPCRWGNARPRRRRSGRRAPGLRRKAAAPPGCAARPQRFRGPRAGGAPRAAAAAGGRQQPGRRRRRPWNRGRRAPRLWAALEARGAPAERRPSRAPPRGARPLPLPARCVHHAQPAAPRQRAAHAAADGAATICPGACHAVAAAAPFAGPAHAPASLRFAAILLRGLILSGICPAVVLRFPFRLAAGVARAPARRWRDPPPQPPCL